LDVANNIRRGWAIDDLLNRASRYQLPVVNKGRHIMKKYWFEIVRRASKRYSWLFVELRDGRQRVLACSARDYRSRKRARRAVTMLQSAVPGAYVIERRCSTDRFMVPDSSFQLVSGVLPLVVGESPIDRYSAMRRRREARQRGSAKRGERSKESAETPEHLAEGGGGQQAS
jgi:uncharacterized protein YegP (UPF0339 family)